MAADVFAVVAGLGLQRPALVGLSMGGTVALQYAQDHPGDLSRLVVVGSFAGVPDEFASVRDQQLASIETHSLRQIAEEQMAAAFTASADPATKAWVIDMIAGGDLEGYRSQARATLAFDVRDRLGEIACRPRSARRHRHRRLRHLHGRSDPRRHRAHHRGPGPLPADEVVLAHRQHAVTPKVVRGSA